MLGTILVKLKQISISLFKLLLAISTILLVAIFILTGGHFFKKSGLSNCVIVADENDFSGEWLKHSKSEVFTRLPTIDCIEKDRHIDSSDGPKKGKVRWAECLYGPDCDEAGMN
jgi:hypothetical protein